MMSELSDEEKQTLWIGGINDQMDEEILYELFINAGPLISVRIPTDRETKRKKPYAFVRFHHAESVPYAIELFRDIRLCGQYLRMQNKATGAGMGGGNSFSHSRNRDQPPKQIGFPAPQVGFQQVGFAPQICLPFQQPFVVQPLMGQVGFQGFPQQQQQQQQQQQHQPMQGFADFNHQGQHERRGRRDGRDDRDDRRSRGYGGSRSYDRDRNSRDNGYSSRSGGRESRSYDRDRDRSYDRRDNNRRNDYYNY